MNLVRNTLLWSARCALPAIVIPLVAGFWRFAAGDAVGILIGALELGSLLFFAIAISPMQAGARVYRLTLLFAIAKLPVIGAGIYLCGLLGWAAVDGFLFGIGLVYSLMVYVAVHEARHRQRDLFS